MIADTPLGKIEGSERDGVIAFRGIRYAQPPVGKLRFKPPLAVEAWTGTYDATTFGAAAPQLQDPTQAVEPISEDCLFLNVYKPASAAGSPDDAKRPVLFWIHGGGYVEGSGRFYNGRVFVKDHDVVVVSINYRMGALGFMHVGHLEDGLNESVNNGILDQICALEWTRDNIHSFGGDPDNVMIFGESAGATSTAMIVGSPRAEGLYHKAIIHSPNVDLIPVGDGHIEFTNRCIERLGGNPTVNGMETLRQASIEELVGLNRPDPDSPAEPTLGLRRPDKVGFSPAIDGHLIPGPIAETIRARGAANVPMMGGGCRHEGTMFAGMLGDNDFTETEAIQLFNSEGFNGNKAMAAYEAFSPGATPRQKLIYALTDTVFRNSMVRILDAAAETGAECWSWMCSWENDQAGVRATHAIELGFLWGWVDQVPDIAGTNPPLDLGPAMRSFWVNFARTGKPFAAGEPAWPPYSLSNRETMVLDAERRIEVNYDDEVRQFWFSDRL
jgi:para-nitrobenzyl esterase